MHDEIMMMIRGGEGTREKVTGAVQPGAPRVTTDFLSERWLGWREMVSVRTLGVTGVHDGLKFENTLVGCSEIHPIILLLRHTSNQFLWRLMLTLELNMYASVDSYAGQG